MAGQNQNSGWMDPTGKSDFDAGLLFLSAVARQNPGLLWDDLQRPEFLAGWWTSLKHSVGDVKDGIGDVLKDTFSTAGSATGDAVRLATDPDVAGSISRAASAYATGGASEGANSIMEAIGNIFTPKGQQAVADAGAAYKGAGFSFSNPWVIGGTVALGVGVLALVVHR